jgi:hypothetical protein
MMVRRVALYVRAASWPCHCGFVRSICIGGESDGSGAASVCLGLGSLVHSAFNNPGDK